MGEPDVRDRRIKGLSERYFMINGKAARCENCHEKIKVSEVKIINGLIYHEECINNTQGNVNTEKRDVLKTMGIGAIIAGASVLGIDRLASASTTISRAGGTYNQGQFVLPGLFFDPVNPLPGQVWYRMDAGVTAFFDGIQGRTIYSNRNSNVITVSSRGISNGLSKVYNDGADFGPDTMQGATSKDQYGPPYSPTLGIQEAINYVTPTGGAIRMFDGIYDITNAPFQTDGTWYYQIMLPQIPSNDTQLNIAIVGNPASRGGLNGNNAYTGGVTIRSLASLPSGESGFIFGVPVANGPISFFNNINLAIDGIHFQTQTGGNLGGMGLAPLWSGVIGHIYIDTNTTVYPPTTLNSGTGFMWGIGSNSNVSYAEEISVFGYYRGVYLNSASHMQINKINVNSCYYGLEADGAYYGAHISHYDVQNCAYGIYFQPTATGNPIVIVIDLISMGDQVTSGYPFDYVATVYDTSNGGLHYLKGNIQYTEGTVTPNFILTQYSKIELTPIGYKATVSTPSVPASGTAQQNQNPYVVEAYISGGAVTQITRTTLEGATYTVYSNSTASAVNMPVRLDPGDSITITYTTAPTWTWVPA